MGHVLFGLGVRYRAWYSPPTTFCRRVARMKKMLRQCVLLATTLLVAAGGASAGDVKSLMSGGTTDFRSGHFEQAAQLWQQAADASKNNPAEHADALIDLGAAQQMLGQFFMAANSLNDAVTAAAEAHDDHRKMLALNALGSVCTCDPGQSLKTAGMPASEHAAHLHMAMPTTAPSAEVCLSQALVIADRLGDSRAKTSILNNVGNYYSNQAKYDAALDKYDQCSDAAKAAGDAGMTAKSACNAAVAANSAAAQSALAAGSAATRDEPEEAANYRSQQSSFTQRALSCNQAAYTAAKDLPASNDKEFLLTTIAQTAIEAVSRSTAPIPDYAEDALKSSSDIARQLGDDRSLSYSMGELGHLYELRGDRTSGLIATRQAVVAAGQAGVAESLYRWQWQVGRLLRADDLPGAIAAYRQAVQTLKSVRADIALAVRNRPKVTSFRDDVGQLYFDLADALLRRADEISKADAQSPEVNQLLVDARDTVEILKGAELEDYFQDKCVEQIKARSKSVDEMLKGHPNTAVVYIIPLADRVELLVTTDHGLSRFTVPVSSADLNKVVATFRTEVCAISTDEYLDPAGQLYQWLISPLENGPNPVIHKDGTLIFVPDGALRTVPMAALFDANSHQFLIEKYAVAVTPGLTLMEPKEFAAGTATVLLNGLSDPVQVQRDNGPPVSYLALPNVPGELYNVKQIFSEGQPAQTATPISELLNETFVEPQVEKRLRGADYAVVHIASHGHFGSTAKETYVVTHDGKQPLSLDDVERLIRPKQFRGTPVELLTLSACETAAGDDRAALGLAGVAVKSGARSAVATLWCVNDATTSTVIEDFYRRLHKDNLSKAQALRSAQLVLIRNHNYNLRHPYLWAPYLLIGNWL